jgi:16S rRNA (guanine527-N7)-methyltransferase
MTNADDRAAFLAAHDVSRETLARLDLIIATLDDWRTRSNLIGPKEWPQIWTRHVGDSVQLLDRIPDTARVVDLGSGAGFPGLILAAARPAGHVTMIESVGKKCAFLRAAIEAADLPATVHQGRVCHREGVRAAAATPRLCGALAVQRCNRGFPKGRTLE